MCYALSVSEIKIYYYYKSTALTRTPHAPHSNHPGVTRAGSSVVIKDPVRDVKVIKKNKVSCK